MPEPRYLIEVTETERAAIARVLGALVSKFINAPVFVESPTGGTAAARAVLAGPQDPPAQSPSVAPAKSPEPRDRWARDRKGNEVPNPDGCETRTVKLMKAERKDLDTGAPRMKVAWPGPERGFVDANCFDEKLFPYLAQAKGSGNPLTIYIMKKDKYLNVIGVRA
jgi:hypothetical protein